MFFVLYVNPYISWWANIISFHINSPFLLINVKKRHSKIPWR